MFTLFSKIEKDTRGCSLKITDCTYSREGAKKHCGDEDGNIVDTKLFPQYDPEQHIIHEGSPLSFPIADNGVIREMRDSELVLTGNRALKDGEIIQDGELVYTPSPGDDYIWDGSSWSYPIEEKKSALLAEVEKEKAKILSEGFLWQGIYQQRCRAEKDIPYIRETLENFNLIPEYSVKWFFTSHPEGYDFTTQEGFLGLRNEGMLFTDKVFRAESGLKLKIKSAASAEDLAFTVREEYLKGLDGFTIPEQV